MHYAAPWSRSLRVTTAIATVILVVVAGMSAAIARRVGFVSLEVAILAISGGALVLTWALAPRGFSVGHGVLRVERRLRPVVVPLTQVHALGTLPPGGLRGALRLAGSGGMFGYFGRFWSRSLGSFRMYATRTDGLVWLDAGPERFVCSPDDPDRFVREVHDGAPFARLAAEAAIPEKRHPIPRRYWWGIGLTVGGVLLAITAALTLSWAFGPRAATVTGDVIRIERRLGRAVELPLSSVQSARMLPPELLCGWWREWGVAGLGDTAYGRFRSRQLGSFELYQWRRGPYVLLETTEGRVVLTPDDPQALLAALGGP
ncbi:MAG: PH domain-containing protein [Myxococcaceae bacterium]|nr:PH domain-containing protein [Myxococcaceae bacterium]